MASVMTSPRTGRKSKADTHQRHNATTLSFQSAWTAPLNTDTEIRLTETLHKAIANKHSRVY
jgi:hypothetical protein